MQSVFDEKSDHADTGIWEGLCEGFIPKSTISIVITLLISVLARQ